MNITIRKTIGRKETIKTTQGEYNRLSSTALTGCPFANYSAWDLLCDLLKMYGWKLDAGRDYTASEFLTLCNDTHAEAYRTIFEA